MLKPYVIAFYFCKACGSYEPLKWTLESLVCTNFCSCINGAVGVKSSGKVWALFYKPQQWLSLGCVKESSKAAKPLRKWQVWGLSWAAVCIVCCCKETQASAVIAWGTLLLLEFPGNYLRHLLDLSADLSKGQSTLQSRGSVNGLNQTCGSCRMIKGASSTHGAAIWTAGRFCFVLGFIYPNCCLSSFNSLKQLKMNYKCTKYQKPKMRNITHILVFSQPSEQC